MEIIDVLDAKFNDGAFKTLALSQRAKITDLVQTLFEDLIELVKPSVIAEIGAFEADFARRMRNRYKDVSVYAFEANPRVYEKFAVQLASAGVVYIHVAVGAKSGKATIHIPEQIANTPMPFTNRMGSLNVVALRDSKTTPVEVPLETLDELLETKDRDRRCAMWIDVEGAVDQVLAGADRTLDGTDLIICELENTRVWHGQVLGAEIRDRLQARGFTIVARDCQKWFQYNAVFVRESVLDSNQAVRERINRYALEAIATWKSFSPPNLFQFWDKEIRPAEVDALMRSWEQDKAFVYRAFDNVSAANMIRREFDARTLAAYQACKVPAMQADLFRLCALYAFGGIYVDADIRNLGTNDLMLEREGRGILMSRGAAVANDLMVIHNKHDPLIDYALKTAVDNIEKRIGGTVWHVTGPGIFTKAFQKFGQEHDMFRGIKIVPNTTARQYFGFQWGLEYKKETSHWTNIPSGQIYNS